YSIALSGTHMLLPYSTLFRSQDELELLSHWCSTTYQSFSAAYNFDPDVWRSIIIRTALHHPALLQGIFALSALQLAYRSTRQDRSEEHTSELQSRFDLVCRLL